MEIAYYHLNSCEISTLRPRSIKKLFQSLVEKVLVRPPLGRPERAQANVCVAVNFKGQCDGPFSRATACAARASRMLPRATPFLFGRHLGLFLVESAVYPHLRRYVCDSAVPAERQGLLPRSENGGRNLQSATTKNQRLRGMGFVVPISTVFGTIVPLRMHVFTYIMNLLKVTPKLHSGGNSLGEISRLLRLSKTTVHQIVKVPAESSEAFTRIIISGFMRHR